MHPPRREALRFPVVSLAIRPSIVRPSTRFPFSVNTYFAWRDISVHILMKLGANNKYSSREWVDIAEKALGVRGQSVFL